MTDEEPEEIVVVCLPVVSGNPGGFDDSVYGNCFNCGRKIQWRPHAKGTKVCLPCGQSMASFEGQEINVTPETMLELEAYMTLQQMKRQQEGIMPKIGDRVGAILGAKDKSIDFLGYGVYESDSIPEEAVGPMAEILRDTETVNPKIRLDSGKVVYGCECWWGPEDQIRKRLDHAIGSGFTLVETDVDSIRALVRSGSES